MAVVIAAVLRVIAFKVAVSTCHMQSRYMASATACCFTGRLCTCAVRQCIMDVAAAQAARTSAAC
jgi:hypothetical protein